MAAENHEQEIPPAYQCWHIREDMRLDVRDSNCGGEATLKFSKRMEQFHVDFRSFDELRNMAEWILANVPTSLEAKKRCARRVIKQSILLLHELERQEGADGDAPTPDTTDDTEEAV